MSPWKLAATTIEVQFSPKQMGERLAFGTLNRNTKVDRLIAKFMHHYVSTDGGGGAQPRGARGALKVYCTRTEPTVHACWEYGATLMRPIGWITAGVLQRSASMTLLSYLTYGAH